MDDLNKEENKQMMIYGIICQSSDDIFCKSVYTDKTKRDKELEWLRKNRECDAELYYEFNKIVKKEYKENNK
jgi:hypothetical protein